MAQTDGVQGDSDVKVTVKDANEAARFGWKYYRGTGVNKDFQKAAANFQTGALMGSRSAKEGLAECYDRGCGVERNPFKAFELWMELADNAYPFAFVRVAEHLEEGNGTQIDRRKARVYWEKAVDLYKTRLRRDPGDAFSRQVLGNCYIHIGKYVEAQTNLGQSTAQHLALYEEKRSVEAADLVAEGLYRLADICYRRSQYGEAIEYIELGKDLLFELYTDLERYADCANDKWYQGLFALSHKIDSDKKMACDLIDDAMLGPETIFKELAGIFVKRKAEALLFREKVPVEACIRRMTEQYKPFRERWDAGNISSTYSVDVARVGVMGSAIGETNKWPSYQSFGGLTVYSYDYGSWVGASFSVGACGFADMRIDHALRNGFPCRRLYDGGDMDRFITQAVVWELSCGLGKKFWEQDADPYKIRPIIRELADEAKAVPVGPSDALLLAPRLPGSNVEKFVVLKKGAWADEHPIG